MKNKLKYAIIVVGMLICITTFINYINAPMMPDNTKSMEFTYEVQDDGSLKLIEEREHMPITIIDVVPSICMGMIMILWATFLYPEKCGESNNGTN